MSQKYILWPAIIIIILIAAGALYYAMNLSSGPSTRPTTPTPGAATSVVDTKALEQAATQNDKDVSDVEDSVTDYEAVDPSQDDLGI